MAPMAPHSAHVAVVIPTRDRSALAARAARSALSQLPPSWSVLVSDNSSRPEERAALTELLEAEPLSLACTAESLPMSAHWEWALQRALRDLNPTHIVILTDRMVFRPGALRRIEAVVRRFGNEIVAWKHDRVDDADPNRVRLNLHPATEGLYRVASQALLDHSATSEPFLWTLPRVLNSVVPVELLQALSSRAGHVFSSLAPDCYFGYWALALVDSFLALDAPPMIHYGLRRSTGYAIVSGRQPRDSAEFQRSNGDRIRLDTPFPDVLTLRNIMLHEYCTVRRVSASEKFRPVEAEALLPMLLRDIADIEDPWVRRDLLMRLGQPAPSDTGPDQASTVSARLGALRRRPARQLVSTGFFRACSQLNYSAVPAPLRTALARRCPGGFFTSLDDALDVALGLVRWQAEGEPLTWPPGSYERVMAVPAA